MSRGHRNFRPRTRYHVVNRGQAHSPIFEGDADVDRFLSLLGWATREGWLQVLAVSVLGTHFHLLVSTRDGRVHYAMHRVEAAYACYYNRTRERPGHVFTGRYFAREIQDDIDLAITTDYIDWNPVKAKMVDSPVRYPHGSARCYAGSAGMSWLHREPLELLVCRLSGASRYSSSDYARVWAFAERANTRELLERTLRSRRAGLAPIRVLVRAGPKHVQRWLLDHLKREEGRSHPCLVLPGSEVLSRLERTGRIDSTTVAAMRVGLLHTTAGWTLAEVAARLDLSEGSVFRLRAAHVRRLKGDTEYLRVVSEFVAQAVRDLYGPLA